ncbi:hypothetical protein RHS01_08247 [Rhizoctonia solani]|uniref:Uncharacterized protein n=1 Tax=Rhizoctonia solani TaxID=456999 RepID=A0A8H7M2H4_9AGAM|nr:hypothetical protein RHS01_08247 [Rhizoctonia solani]
MLPEVLKFPGEKQNRASVHYKPRFGFGYGQTDEKMLFHPTVWAEARAGDVIGLSGTPDQLKFDEIIRGSDSGPLVCQNNTNGPIDLSMVYFEYRVYFGSGANQIYQPTLIWTDVCPGASVTAQFKPKLSAYITREYQATEMLRGEVVTDEIWSQNLDELDNITGWYLMEDRDNGTFAIVLA